MIHIVVAVGENNEIGKDNKMLWHNSEELRFFRKLTLNHKIVMGKNTYLSIGRPLDLRENIVISTTLEENEDIYVLRNIDKILEKYVDSDEIIYVIGGENIYKQFLKYTEKIYLSKIDGKFPDADRYFPSINYDEYSTEVVNYNTFKLYIYTRRKDE
ncbi:dihydrofolate reductase [Streptobacillus moniliformis]|uniref:dihydrofolate reductase n=1 Tax=Streptobacillus moniliformis (strain ATCC 14647 / DSM 12112 / NCTC 10651 / 9901) TaxID=519441 RepID=D1AYS8_STRM9|nr:dihydrofolate reductase [Streptobacillus moniliformis]ACZ01454.1 dihydrofolate reductase region [Streptobacillus moniliformis DSM 12112]AVL43539.1 dihydrofolate reductase [Streptobacillus moniliformis]SQA13385.1 Dihydrofolate reductase [Streptobacillus moniliformis]